MYTEHDIRIVLDASGRPQAGSANSRLPSGQVIVRPAQAGPFDTPEEFFEQLYKMLDIQLTLW